MVTSDRQDSISLELNSDCFTFAFVGISRSGSTPRPIKMERFTPLTVSARGIVFAFACQLSVAPWNTAARVTVALASPTDGEVSHGVLMGHLVKIIHDPVVIDVGSDVGRIGLLSIQHLHLVHQLHRRTLSLVVIVIERLEVLLHQDVQVVRDVFDGHVKPIESNFDICGRHPVLEYRRVVEIQGARSAFEGAKRYSRRVPLAQAVSTGVAMCVGTSSLLLVNFCNCSSVWSPVNPPALARVKLKRLPCLPVIYAFINRYAIGLWRVGAKLQTHVSQFIFLPETESQRNVIRRSVDRCDWRQGLRSPAGYVVRVVQIRQIRCGESTLRLVVIAQVTLGVGTRFGRFAEVLWHVEAARRGRFHRHAKSRVHEIGDAPAGTIVVVAGVGGLRLTRKHLQKVVRQAGHQ